MNFKAILAFLGQYYDRIIAVVVMIGLLVFSVMLISEVNNIQSRIKQQNNRPTPKMEKPADVEPMRTTISMLDAPRSWSSNHHRLFIGPHMKVLDPSEPYPQRYDDKNKEDRLIDGIRESWLKKYGLSTKTLVGETDPDDDGFTVREEYAEDTNPVDATSKPDVALKLRVEKIIQKPFPFIFNGVNEGTEGVRYSILRRDGKKNYYCKMEETIPDPNDPGYKIIKYEEKTDKVEDKTIRGPDGKWLIKTVDVSELTLKKGDANPVVLVKSRQGTADDLFARLYFILDSKFFEVGSTSKFPLQNGQYQVVSIKKLDGGRPEVIIKRVDGEKQFNLLQLKKEEINSNTTASPTNPAGTAHPNTPLRPPPVPGPHPTSPTTTPRPTPPRPGGPPLPNPAQPRTPARGFPGS